MAQRAEPAQHCCDQNAHQCPVALREAREFIGRIENLIQRPIPALRPSARVSSPACAASPLRRGPPCGRGRATPIQWGCQRQAQRIRHCRPPRTPLTSDRPSGGPIHGHYRRLLLARLPKPRRGERNVPTPKLGSRKPPTKPAAAAVSIRSVTATGRSTGWRLIFEKQESGIRYQDFLITSSRPPTCQCSPGCTNP